MRRFRKIGLPLLLLALLSATDARPQTSPNQRPPSGGPATARPAAPGLTAISPDGIINASLEPQPPSPAKPDLGYQVSKAIEALKSTCGSIEIPPGSYTWSTPDVRMKPCQTLFSPGSGAIVNVSPMSAPFLAISAVYPQTDVGLSLVQGSVKGITFIGPGDANDVNGHTWDTARQTQPGIYIGGDPNKVWTEPDAIAVVSTLSDLHLRGFGCGLQFGNGYQIGILFSVIEGNFNGVCFAGSNALENINFSSTQILNNIDNGLVTLPKSSFVEIDLNSVSVDYNGQQFTGGRAINFTNAGSDLNIHGGHFEGPLHSVTIATVGALKVSKTRFNFVNTKTFQVLPNVISIEGTNGWVSLNDLVVEVPYPDGKITELVGWNTRGADNHLFIGKYTFTIAFNLITLPPVHPGANIQFWEYPIFNSVGDLVGVDTNNYTASGSGFAVKKGQLALPAAGAGITLGAPGVAGSSTIAAATDGTGKTDDTSLVFGPTGLVVRGKDPAHASLNTPALSFGTFIPQAETVAPSGSCSIAGEVRITSDGHFTYCNATTKLWTRLY